MERWALTQAVKAEARRLGFDLVGVTDCSPPASYAHYEAWLAAGYHAGMAYMARERNRLRRADPRRILPECQSIVVVAVRYAAPPHQDALRSGHDRRAAKMPNSHSEGRAARSKGERMLTSGGQSHMATAPALDVQPSTSGPEGPFGQVAAYAWGLDYHDVLPPRLRDLVAFIEAQVGHPVPHRIYTDTGPVLERDLAQRAGLGWIGKSGMLIHPRLGSYLLLAEVLLGVALEPDPPFPTDHCGTCQRCVEACPTQAILPDRTVDANRCLSYWTIEHRGALPEALRPALGTWVFGCDVCQQVCPWNRRVAPEGDPAFAPRPEVPRPLLLEELKLSPEAFRHKFRGSPVKRAKRQGYLRNVAVALGNIADPRAVPALTEALHDEHPWVRGHAAWALGRIGTPEARAALRTALPREADSEVRAEIQAALETSAKAAKGGPKPPSSRSVDVRRGCSS